MLAYLYRVRQKMSHRTAGWCAVVAAVCMCYPLYLNLTTFRHHWLWYAQLPLCFAAFGLNVHNARRQFRQHRRKQQLDNFIPSMQEHE